MKKLATLLITSLSYYANAQEVTVLSPNKNMQLKLEVNNGVSYSVNYKNKPVILASSLGIKFSEPAVELKNFSLIKIDSSSFDQTWQPVWGEYSNIRDNHKEIRLQLQEKSGILVNVV